MAGKRSYTFHITHLPSTHSYYKVSLSPSPPSGVWCAVNTRGWTTVYQSNKASPRLFIAISSIAALQFVFWGYLSYYALTELDQVDKRPTSKKQSIMSSFKLRVVVSLVSLGAGAFFAVSAFMYPLRVVRSFSVSSEAVRLVTATPLGGCRHVTAPLRHVTCSTARLTGTKKGVFGVKIRGHVFYFLLDHQVLDTSPHVRLFDRLIATRQTIQ